MSSSVIKLPIMGKQSVAIATLPRREATPDDREITHYTCWVVPTVENGLNQIPKGPNPRYVNSDSKIPKEIEESFLTDENFAIKNRGMQVIIDDGSFNTLEESGKHYITFKCSEHGMTGHYDGAHTCERVTAAIENRQNDGIVQHLPLHLVERSAFKALRDARSAANAINNVQRQKKMSEFDIAGGFEKLKNSLTYCSKNNVGWAQNQLSDQNTPIATECQAIQVICLLSSFLPMTFDREVPLEKITKWPKLGEKVIQQFEADGVSCYLDESAQYIDVVLELSDFVQSNMSKIMGPRVDNFGILKASSTAQLNKSISDRKGYKQTLFKDAKKVENCLNKDLMPMICYAIINSTCTYNNGYNINFKIEEMKAIWKAAAYDVLSVIENRHKTNFRSTYKSRWSDFVLDTQMWNQCAAIVQRIASDKKLWSKHIVQYVEI